MNLNDVLPLLDHYPPWVRYLLGAILVLTAVFLLALLFARNAPAGVDSTAVP